MHFLVANSLLMFSAFAPLCAFFNSARFFSRVAATASPAVSGSPEPRGSQGTRVYYLALVGVIIVWGSSFVVVDVAVQVAPPLAVATWRFIFASIFFLSLTPIAKKRGFWIEKGKVSEKTVSSKRYFFYNLAASLTGISLFFPAQYTSISLIGPSIPALVVCLGSPVITAVLAIFFFKERLFRAQIVGFILASIGVFFIITEGDISQIIPTASDFLGNLLALLTPVMWSLYNIAIKKAEKFGSSFQITSYTTYLGLVGLFLGMLLSGGFSQWILAITHIEVVIATIYLAAGCSLFGYLVWNLALAHLQTANVGAFLYVEPFITVFFAWIFLQDVISPYSVLGGAIVLIALMLITRHKPPTQKL